MSKKLRRREFVKSGAAAAGLAAASQTVGAAPTMITAQSVKPVVIASGNGNRYKNGGDETCVERAFRMMTSGKDVL